MYDAVSKFGLGFRVEGSGLYSAALGRNLVKKELFSVQARMLVAKSSFRVGHLVRQGFRMSI